MKLHNISFGCQMNFADSDEMSVPFFERGFTETQDLQQADAVMVNTCTVRDHAEGIGVESLEYEAYAAMAEKVMRGIVGEVEAEFGGTRGAVLHRTGHLSIGDRAVVVAVSSPHRAEAFGACQRIIDRLKEDAPIWKREHREGGVVWVGLGP